MKKTLLFFCLITRSDPKLCAQSNCFDQITIAANAIALLTLCLVSTIAWTVFWQSFTPAWQALPLGFLCALIIAQIEAAMAASDWELAGVLRTSRPGAAYWFRIGLRLLIASLLAQATAVGVTLVLYSGAIQTYLQNQRTAQNAVVESEYASRKNEIRARIIGSIERELTAAQEARLRDQEALRLLQAQRDAAQNRSDTAYIEAGRELDGLERLKGPGARYRDANRQHNVAERLKASTTAELNRVQASLKLQNARIEKLNDQLSLRSSELHARWQALESEKVRDPRWIAKRDDPLLRYMALQELKGDAVKCTPLSRQFFGEFKVDKLPQNCSCL